jgi:hypothetical protein
VFLSFPSATGLSEAAQMVRFHWDTLQERRFANSGLAAHCQLVGALAGRSLRRGGASLHQQARVGTEFPGPTVIADDAAADQADAGSGEG